MSGNEAAFKKLYECMGFDISEDNTLLYGTIARANPLVVDIGNNVTLDGDMLIVSSYLVSEHELKVGERVVLFAFNGNSVFYIAERL
jgi:hypothetical protein